MRAETRKGSFASDTAEPTRKKLKNQEDDANGKGPWACPFYARYPKEYENCGSLKLTRLSDVTQHLSRKHLVPIHCPRCGQRFANGGELERHIVQGCEVKQFTPYHGVTLDQMCAIRKGNPESDVPEATNKYERRWYGKFTTMFGHDAARPTSPYRSVFNDDITQKIRSYIDEGHLHRFAKECRPDDSRFPHDLLKLLHDFAEKASPDNSTRDLGRPSPVPRFDPTSGKDPDLPTSPGHNTLSLLGPFPSDGGEGCPWDDSHFGHYLQDFSAPTNQGPEM